MTELNDATDFEQKDAALLSRRNFMGNAAIVAGGVAAVSASRADAQDKKQASTVALDWKEVYYTNCPLVSASNVDQELGWVKEEYSKIGVEYAYFRSRLETNWYPHYVHNMDNLIRFGGLFPPIHVHADIRRTRLLGATHVPWEGGAMMVRARDDIYTMQDLKAGHAIDGPAIVIQDTATIVVEPDCNASVNQYGDVERKLFLTIVKDGEFVVWHGPELNNVRIECECDCPIERPINRKKIYH